MTRNINIFFKSPDFDIFAKKRHREIVSFDPSFKDLKITSCHSYEITGYTDEQIKMLAQELFCDPIIEDYYIDDFPEGIKKASSHAIQIGYKDGVTDNISRSALQGILSLIPQEKNKNSKTEVRNSMIYFFDSISDSNAERLEKIASKLFYNPLIQYEHYHKQYVASIERKELSIRSIEDNTTTKKAIPQNIPPYQIINLSKDDDALLKFSQEKLLFLNLQEMKAIQSHYQNPTVQEKRKSLGLPPEITDVEIEVLAQTWSEHCKHKIFAAKINYVEKDKAGEIIEKEEINSLYKSYIKKTTHIISEKRDDLLSVFSDNAGIVSFDEKDAYCMKVETHNSPSALDPYGGAMTGIVGVNRDIIGTGMGAKPIFNTDVFCFADPFYKGKIPNKLMHPQRIFKGVHRGVEEGGNQSGIPTVNGAIVFDNRFLGKPLVFCGTGGIMPKKIIDPHTNAHRETHLKEILPGDLIVMVGGRIGKDGIHGATFSSAALKEDSPTSAVQIGDPITQKKLLDFILIARDEGYIRTLTDNGAGGLSSSIGEMATLVGGCELHLEKAPLKYEGLQPWEILISEAQERMSLAIDLKHQKSLMELAKIHDVEISFLGTFNASNEFLVYFKGQVVCNLDMTFLHEGVPQLDLNAIWDHSHLKKITPTPQESFYQRFEKMSVSQHQDLLVKMLQRYNIASKEYWVRQYDHEVQGKTVIKPFDGVEHDAPMDAAVVKPKYESEQGLVISNGLAPRYSDIDTYTMSLSVVDEAVRNIVATGGNPDTLVGLDNFCWPDPIQSPATPDGEYKLAQLVRSCKGLHNICLAYNLPLISGKDSMKNDYGEGEEKISVPPTLLFTAIAKINDVKKSMTTPFKSDNSFLFQLGETYPELGGSEFFAEHDQMGEESPKVNYDKNIKLYRVLHQAIQKDMILACHDLSDGGLLIALAESAFGGMVGCEIDLKCLPSHLKTIEKLYSESNGRFIVEIAEGKLKEFKNLFEEHSYYQLGKTNQSQDLTISQDNRLLLKADLRFLKNKWKEALVF